MEGQHAPRGAGDREPQPEAASKGSEGGAAQEGSGSAKDRKAQGRASGRKSSAKQLKDPVDRGRCSLGRFAYGLLSMAGVVFFVFGLSAEPMDVWEMCNAAFLFLQSMYTIIFLGGDPCLINGFRESLRNFHKENERLKRSNDALEMKLGELGEVADGLEGIAKQMGQDIEAATSLLVDMERFSNLQTASAVVHQFFAADLDGSGHINGDEADYFVPQFVALWEMLPGFDQQRLVDHVRAHGLTLQQLSILLDALIAEDPVACQRELEEMITREEAPASAAAAERRGRARAGGAQVIGNPAGAVARAPPRIMADEMVHFAAPPLDRPDIEEGPRRAHRIVKEARHRMMPQVEMWQPPDLAKSEPIAEKLPEQPLPSSPRRDPSKPFIDQHVAADVEAGGPREGAPLAEGAQGTTASAQQGAGPRRAWQQPHWLRCRRGKHGDPMAPCLDCGCFVVWGWTHFAMMICALASLVFVGSSFVIMELTNIVCALVAASLATGLMASSRLLKVLSALKKEVKFLSHENDRLEGYNQSLAERVAQLVRLRRGFEILQAKCHGNAAEAQKLITKSNLAVKSSAIGVVTQLFKRADANLNHTLDEGEVEQFVESLDLVFRTVPNFDAGAIRANIAANGLSARQLKDLVDYITAAAAAAQWPAW